MPSQTAPGWFQGSATLAGVVTPGVLQYQGTVLKRKDGRPAVVRAMMPSSTTRR